MAIAIWVALAGPAFAEMIHLQARQGSVAGVQVEIDKGVPVDLRSAKHTTQKEVTALYGASKFGKTDVVMLLLENGADLREL
jgi:ankyrin repeat protein